MSLPVAFVVELPDDVFARTIPTISTIHLRVSDRGTDAVARMTRDELDRRVRKTPVDDTAYIAENARDPQFLTELLARDKRKAVRAAVTSNARLPADVFADYVTSPATEHSEVRAALAGARPGVLLGAITHNPAVAALANRHIGPVGAAVDRLVEHTRTRPARAWVPALTGTDDGYTLLANIIDLHKPSNDLTEDAYWDIIDAADLAYRPDGPASRAKVRTVLAKRLTALVTDQPAALARAPWPELALEFARHARNADTPVTVAGIAALASPGLDDPDLLGAIALLLLNFGTVLDGPTIVAALHGNHRNSFQRTHTVDDSAVAELLAQPYPALGAAWGTLAVAVLVNGNAQQVADLVCGRPGPIELTANPLEGAATRLGEAAITRIVTTAPVPVAITMGTSWAAAHPGDPHADTLVRVIADRFPGTDPAMAGLITPARATTLAAAATSEATVLALADAFAGLGVTVLNAAYWTSGAVNEGTRRHVLSAVEAARIGAATGPFWATVPNIGIPPILATLPPDAVDWLTAHTPAAAHYLIGQLPSAPPLPIIDALTLHQPAAQMVRTARAGSLARWLTDALRDQPAAWETALGLLPDWDGTAIDLAAAAHSLTGPAEHTAPDDAARAISVTRAPVVRDRSDLGR